MSDARRSGHLFSNRKAKGFQQSKVRILGDYDLLQVRYSPDSGMRFARFLLLRKRDTRSREVWVVLVHAFAAV